MDETLREWAPLTELINQLPVHAPTGLFLQQVKITCVDFVSEFIALGTNVGVVYWYDRRGHDLQRLRCEVSNAPLTVVKVISSVEFMVACGSSTGHVTIFQIPKRHSEALPDNLKSKKQQVERYTVSDLHKSSISALEWAKNGMKLFSGDRNGVVVLTELDFYMNICKSFEVLNEAYEVIQLSYHQQRLLISTSFRSIVCQKSDKWKVCQVGKKERKVLGNFGGIIFKRGYKSSDISLYCTRPGLRLWVADAEGNVQKTLLFKELLNKDCCEVPLINPISKKLQKLKPQKEASFGILLPFNDNLLITHNDEMVYILDPQQMTVLSTISHLRGVLCVATHKDELLILEEERSLIRISYRPQILIQKSIASTSQEPEVVKAEEAIESPQKQNKFDEIGKKDFDNILFKKFSTQKKKTAMTTSTSSLSSNSSEEKEVNYTQPMIMNLSCVGTLPDLRSPESINSDIEYKEKILADILNFDKKIDLTGLTSQEKPVELVAQPIIEVVQKEEAVISKSKPPVVVNIPNDWKLADIKLTDKEKESCDCSFNDWEIL